MKSTEQSTRKHWSKWFLNEAAKEYEAKLEQRAKYVRLAFGHGLTVGEIAENSRMTRTEVEAILATEGAA